MTEKRSKVDDAFRATLWLAPHAMKRPRKAKSGHMYSPSAGEVRLFQSELRAAGFHNWAKYVEGKPLSVHLGFMLERPKTTKFRLPTSKRHGDVDNHIKTLLDAINGFIPDELVVAVSAVKLWAKGSGCVTLVVHEFEPREAGGAI